MKKILVWHVRISKVVKEMKMEPMTLLLTVLLAKLKVWFIGYSLVAKLKERFNSKNLLTTVIKTLTFRKIWFGIFDQRFIIRNYKSWCIFSGHVQPNFNSHYQLHIIFQIQEKDGEIYSARNQQKERSCG